MERKFKNNPDFEKQYKEFMNEYESLGHMSLVNSRSYTSKDQNVLPHHAVIKPSSTTTKCIKQIALDNKDNPNLSRVLQEDIYMDDLLSGADTPNNAISICKNIVLVLSTHGFHLRKWNYNSTEFLAQFSEHSSHDTRVEFSKDSNESSKVLGLFWNSSNDTFGFQPSLELTPPLTKKQHLKLWKFYLHWRHVPSKENPADIASRGIDPKCLPDCKLWWQGPPWLRLETSRWPKAESSCDEASDEVKAEQKSVSIFNLFTHTSNDVIHSFFEHYSSLTKIIRIFAYCKRFIKNCKRIASQGSSISSSHINTTSLTFSETKTAEETIIRWVQGFYFQNEIQNIKKQISLPPKSPLRSLHPFIDEHGLVRVGGRLQNSQLRFNSKHPIILPSQHSISELLIKEQHIAHLHAGLTLLAHVLRQSHWIVGSRKLINKCIRKCLKCNKFKTSTTTPQLMGNLPKHRVTLERPFFSCGIDYAGPVLIKCNKGRGTKSTKGYIALFVCLATKAVHIEAVGDLTADSFIAAPRRFSVRRGVPRHIYSHNGTNVVGARDVLLSVPEELPSTSNHRDRWELLQNIKRGFWKKWSSKFISSLQPRKQWQDTQPNLKEDDIVLIKEEGPPGTWPMARVLQVHPGNDGLVRVATVKTQNSVLKQPVHKLHKLPIYPN
ncbi:integrase catalytic domain-containing protein [Trichonephila clavipes]|nr:integrase catalytic domain-containing protein [Trichonephila clavipes]